MSDVTPDRQRSYVDRMPGLRGAAERRVVELEAEVEALAIDRDSLTLRVKNLRARLREADDEVEQLREDVKEALAMLRTVGEQTGFRVLAWARYQELEDRNRITNANEGQRYIA